MRDLLSKLFANPASKEELLAKQDIPASSQSMAIMGTGILRGEGHIAIGWRTRFMSATRIRES